MTRISLLLLALLATALASQSPFVGKITLRPLDKDPAKVITFRPLSEQPKIANLKNNDIQLTLVSDVDSCKVLPPIDISPSFATIAIIDVSKVQRMACGLNIKKTQLKAAGLKGLMLVANLQAAKSYCHMLDDSHFLMGIIDPQNFNLVLDYNKKGSVDNSNFKVRGVLTVELFNSTAKLLEVWTSSLNAGTYSTLAMLDRSMKKLTSLGSQVQWTPRIASYDCTHGQDAKVCATSDFVASCACKGLFCSPEKREKTPAPLVQEDIRQLLIFKQHGSKYFDYMSAFKDKCFAQYQKEKYIDECAASVMESLGIDSYSINSVVESFLDQCVEVKTVEQSYIYNTLHRDQKAFASYGRYPLILINKQVINYRSEEDFNGALCNKLLLTDPACFTIVDTTTITTTGAVFFVLLILTLVGVGAGVVYCYRKKLKREMNKQIKMQVSTAVEHYFALTETSHAK